MAGYCGAMQPSLVTPWSSHGSRHPALLEALAAQDRPSLRGAERYSGFLIAVGADRAGFDLVVDGCAALSIASIGTEGGGTFGFAELAAFGLVLELLVVKEKLLTGCENKISSTIHTGQ